MRIDVEKHGFVKTEKNLWMGWDDYLLSNINPEYGFFLYCTFHYPREVYMKSDSIEDKMCKIILHRHYDYENFDSEHYDHEVVYRGLVDTDKYFETLLTKLGIK